MNFKAGLADRRFELHRGLALFFKFAQNSIRGVFVTVQPSADVAVDFHLRHCAEVIRNRQFAEN
jgi:hypothetical protein